MQCTSSVRTHHDRSFCSQEMRAAGCRILAEGETYIVEKKKKELEGSVKKAKDNTPFLQGGKLTHRSNRYMKRETGDGEPSPSGELRSNQKPRSGGHQSISGGNGLNTASSKDTKKSGGVSDLAGYPGMESLSFTVSSCVPMLLFRCWSGGSILLFSQASMRRRGEAEDVNIYMLI